MDSYRILGVSLVEMPPLDTVHIRWEPGVTVLYGRNGAGKTTILQGLRSAVLGIAPVHGSAILHLEIREDRHDGDSHGNTFGESLISLVRHYVDEGPDAHLRWGLATAGEAEEMKERLNRSDKDAVQVFLEDALPWHRRLPGIVEEITNPIRLSLFAAGSSEQPAWFVTISAVPSTNTPGINELTASYREAREPDGHGSPAVTAPFWWGIAGSSDGDRFLDAPPWVPLPMADIGSTTIDLNSHWWRSWGDSGPTPQPDDMPVLISDESFDLERATEIAVTSAVGEVLKSSSDTALHLNPELESELAELASAANRLLAMCFAETLNLKAVVRPPVEWQRGGVVQWEAADPTTGTTVPFRHLSEAQQRWAGLAVGAALTERFRLDGSRLVIVDEPERALHRRAMQHAAEGLANLAGYLESPVLIASHSAEFLATLSPSLVHVWRRPDGLAETSLMDSTASRRLFEVVKSVGGVEDVLQLTRVWVVVEGSHDQAVLEASIGSELEHARAQILPMRGSKGLRAVIDSQFLYEYTDAAVLVVLDRTRHQKLRPIMDQARSLKEAGKHREAAAALRGHLGTRLTDEERAAVVFLVEAAGRNLLSRVNVFGLGEADIIYYLPVQAFLPDVSDWSDLQPERRGRSIKSVVADRRRGKQVTAKELRRVAGKMDSTPDEFAELLNRVIAISRST